MVLFLFSFALCVSYFVGLVVYFVSVVPVNDVSNLHGIIVFIGIFIFMVSGMVFLSVNKVVLVAAVMTALLLISTFKWVFRRRRVVTGVMLLPVLAGYLFCVITAALGRGPVINGVP